MISFRTRKIMEPSLMILEVVITATQVSPVHKKTSPKLKPESKVSWIQISMHSNQSQVRKPTSSEQKVLVWIKQGRMSKKRMRVALWQLRKEWVAIREKPCCKKGKAWSGSKGNRTGSVANGFVGIDLKLLLWEHRERLYSKLGWSRDQKEPKGDKVLCLL